MTFSETPRIRTRTPPMRPWLARGCGILVCLYTSIAQGKKSGAASVRGKGAATVRQTRALGAGSSNNAAQDGQVTYTLPKTADQMRRLLPWLLAAAYAQEKPYYEVVFAVLTVPQHRPHRDAIRNGYGQPGGFRTKLWFVVSEKDPG